VVEWKDVLKHAPTLLRRMTKKEGVGELRKSLDSHWRPKGQPPVLGQAVLELYFAQIVNPSGLFLDLRRKHFAIDEKHIVTFTPNGFWVKWQEPFREGLLNIYTGYYEDRSDLIDKGLGQIGLINSEMSPNEVLEVKNMLLAHIGGDYRQQKFLIADFTASFERFFNFLLDKKIRLSADFLYLGIYLASLYHCLQEEGGVYDVQQCFQRARG
jgi:hypothetical protein